MSPCTPAACWVGPGRARWRPRPRRRQRRWSSWCQPGCRDCRCSEGDFYCGKKRGRRRVYLLFVICQTDPASSDLPSHLWRVAASQARVETTEQLLTPNSLVTDVILGERDVFDQHGWLGAEEDSQHRLQESKTRGQHEARGPVRATATNRTSSLSLNVFCSLLQLRTYSDKKSRKWSAEYCNWQTWDLRTFKQGSYRCLKSL